LVEHRSARKPHAGAAHHRRTFAKPASPEKISATDMFARPAQPRMTRQQQLASKPLRLVDTPITDGRLTVKIEQKKWSRWLLRLPKNATKTFEFDALGQLVWSACDGKTTVQQIARRLARTHNVTEREAQVATEKFLVMLAKKGLIGAAVKPVK
jgi:hypothetical protein